MRSLSFWSFNWYEWSGQTWSLKAAVWYWPFKFSPLSSCYHAAHNLGPFLSVGIKTNSKISMSGGSSCGKICLLMNVKDIDRKPIGINHNPLSHSQNCSGHSSHTYISLHTTPLYKIMVNFCLPAQRPLWMVILPVVHIRAVLKSKTISLWW